MRVGHGKANGAVSIVNATATGQGCSLAVEGGAEATWRWDAKPGLRFDGPDGALARAVHAQIEAGGAWARCVTRFPPARGLKTSSAAAAALLRAALAARGEEASATELAARAVAASRAAGVTLTGALDDQLAVIEGGCVATDNRAGLVLARPRARPWHVAVWIPQASIAKARVAAIDAAPAADGARHAFRLAQDGRLPEALTANGEAYTRLYAAAGLPVDPRPAQAALAAGALGAGLSGTGPAVAALFDAPAALPAVRGGIWAWTRTVQA